MADGMRDFGGSIPEYYDSIMGPAQFEAYGALATDFATGQLRGTPRGQLIAQRGGDVDAAIAMIAKGLAALGGEKPFRYTPQALVVEARAA